jgi:ankyrin repeat protein
MTSEELVSGMTSLHAAARKGLKEVVELLISEGVDVNAKNEDGWTPLHMAAAGGQNEIVELLIAAGADVNAKDRVGETPLDFAIQHKKSETADLLRKHGGKTGAELNILLDAAKNGDIEAVKQHLAAGADVNAKTGDGTTPLHNAAVYGHNEIAELLIANGASVNAIIVSGRNQGKTPVDLAIWRKKTETADLIRKHGGRTAEEIALMPRLVQHGRFAFSFDAKEGKVYEVQDSFDLLNWEAIKTYTGTGATVRFDEERDHDPPQWFYRVRVVE